MGISRDQIIRAFHRTLTDFGYDDLTIASVEAATAKALVGDYEEDIIAKFIYGWVTGEYASLRPILEQKEV